MDLIREIKNLYGNIDNKNLAIIEAFSRISSECIDERKTQVIVQNNFIKIQLFGVNNQYCPLEFNIGIKSNLHRINIDFIDVCNILYYEDYSDDQGFKDVLDTVEGVLSNEIVKTDYYVGDTLYKSVITSPYFKIDDKEFIEFSKKEKNLWFWQRTVTKELKYKAWSSGDTSLNSI